MWPCLDLCIAEYYQKNYLGKKRINYDRKAERGRDERPFSERKKEIIYLDFKLFCVGVLDCISELYIRVDIFTGISETS